MTFFYLLTLVGPGATYYKTTNTITVPANATRQQVFDHVYGLALQEFPGGCPIAFDLQPNELTTH